MTTSLWAPLPTLVRPPSRTHMHSHERTHTHTLSDPNVLKCFSFAFDAQVGAGILASCSISARTDAYKHTHTCTPPFLSRSLTLSSRHVHTHKEKIFSIFRLCVGTLHACTALLFGIVVALTDAPCPSRGEVDQGGVHDQGGGQIGYW